MQNSERDELKNALLRYCELDTLAMVMIIVAWLHMLQKQMLDMRLQILILCQHKFDTTEELAKI